MKKQLHFTVTKNDGTTVIDTDCDMICGTYSSEDEKHCRGASFTLIDKASKQLVFDTFNKTLDSITESCAKLVEENEANA